LTQVCQEDGVEIRVLLLGHFLDECHVKQPCWSIKDKSFFLGVQ
jgi:hypothetical protein